MCAPGASMAVGAVGAVVSLFSSFVEYQAAMEDFDARSTEWRENYSSAIAAKSEEENQLSLRMMEEEEAYVQSRHSQAVEGAKARASAEAASATAGAAGISVDNIQVGIARDLVATMEAEDIQHKSVVSQLGNEVKSAETRAENRVNSIQIPNKPNELGFILKGIGGALAAF